MTYVISLGGSIVSPPSGPDAVYLSDFRNLVEGWLGSDPSRRLILVVGGGGPARAYQGALREFARLRSMPPPSDEALDRVGIAATKINAQLVAAAMEGLCIDPVVEDPSAPISFTGKILVASGWKPGFSSDYDAVYLGERFGAKTVLNLSNIAKVYTADPKLDRDARPLDEISWAEFRALVGEAWTPGANLPFDPIASARAEEAGMRVICASGKDLPNLLRILNGESFTGTLIG
ncbi:MAG TPA: UMP kinase [Rectinemataceae bacterium]